MCNEQWKAVSLWAPTGAWINPGDHKAAFCLTIHMNYPNTGHKAWIYVIACTRVSSWWSCWVFRKPALGEVLQSSQWNLVSTPAFQECEQGGKAIWRQMNERAPHKVAGRCRGGEGWQRVSCASADVSWTSMWFLTFLSIPEEYLHGLPVTLPRQLAEFVKDRSGKTEE